MRPFRFRLPNGEIKVFGSRAERRQYAKRIYQHKATRADLDLSVTRKYSRV